MYTPEQQQAYAYYMSQGHDEQTSLNAALTNYPAPAAAPAMEVAPVAQAVQQAVAPVAQTGAVNSLLSIVNEVAEEEDHSSTSQGMKARPGIAWLRILGYVEIGIHAPANPQHTAKPIAYLMVEMHHPDHLRQDGTPTVERIRISKTHSGNSAFPKLFKHLRSCFPNENITHMGQLIGRPLLGTVYHNKDANDKVWVNFDNEGAWSFAAASGTNPDQTTYTIAIPELVGTPQLFLYDCPKTINNPAHMKAMWDSIYIAGEREWEDATTKEKKKSSNNQWQERLVKSVKWATSETKRVLDQLGVDTVLGQTMATAPAQQAPALAAPALGTLAAPVAQPALQPVQAIAEQATNFVPATPQVMHAQPAVPVQVAPVAQPVPQMAAPAVQQEMAPVHAPVQEAQAVQQFNQAVAPAIAPVPAMQAPAQAAPAMMDPNAFMAQYQ